MDKREQQRKKKEQKQQAALKRERMKRTLVKIGLFIVLPAILIAAAFTALNQGPTYSTVEIVESDHVRGIRATPVPVVVYADFQCPACATENTTITRIWPQIRDKAHLVFRHFPISAAHRHSWDASLYAEAAGKQGRFWEMHDLLFVNQGLWSSMGNVEDEFDSYALQLGLDLDQLKLDMDSEEVINKIRSDQRGGNSAGVLATPSVFINGRLVPNASAERIIELVEEAYDEAEAAQAATAG